MALTYTSTAAGSIPSAPRLTAAGPITSAPIVTAAGPISSAPISLGTPHLIIISIMLRNTFSMVVLAIHQAD